MKTAFAAAMALLIACLLVGNALAQEKSNFQSVGGDYGRNVLSNIGASDAETASKSESNQSLWSWGGAPKGSLIVDGNIIGDPRYTLKNLSVIRDWLGDSFVDPYGDTPAYSYFDPVTGERVKTYVDPITGQHYYTYTDSNSGKLVYVYFNPETGEPIYASFTPISGQYIEEEQYSLPPILT
jgi:hypothetical protein